MNFWDSFNLASGGLLEELHEVKSLSHVRLFADPMDCNPPGSSIHGILQARILEWVAITMKNVNILHF